LQQQADIYRLFLIQDNLKPVFIDRFLYLRPSEDVISRVEPYLHLKILLKTVK